MHYLTEILVKYLVENEIVKSERKEEYIYGIEMIFGKVVNYFTIGVISIINRNVMPTLVFAIAFFAMRERTGGYHANTFLRCYVGTTALYLAISLGVTTIISGKIWIYILILIFSWIIIIEFAPVNHPNVSLSAEEVSKWRKSSILMLLIITVVVSVCMVLDIAEKCVLYAILGIGADAILLYIAKLKGQELEHV